MSASSLRPKLGALLQDVSISSAAVDALDLLHHELLQRIADEISSQACVTEKTRLAPNRAIDDVIGELGLDDVANRAMSTGSKRRDTLKKLKKERKRKSEKSTEQLEEEQERLFEASRKRMAASK